MNFIIATRMSARMFYFDGHYFTEDPKRAAVYCDRQTAIAQRDEQIISCPKWMGNRRMVAIPHTTNNTENYYSYLEANNEL